MRFKSIVTLRTAALFWVGVTISCTAVFAANAGIADAIYARGLYPVLTRGVTFLSAALPVSLTELFLYSAVLVVIAWNLAVLRRKITVRVWGLRLITLFGFCFAWFYLFWGFNYFATPLKQKIGFSAERVDSTAIRASCDALLQETNDLYFGFPPLHLAVLDTLIERQLHQLAGLPGFQLTPGRRRPKRFLLNFWLNKTTTSGFFSPLFHEIHINGDLLPFEQPFIVAHEKAHQLGITDEAEASFVAYLACSSSNDPRLQYSARIVVLGQFLARLRPEYDSYWRRLRPEVQQDFLRARKRWQRHRGWLSRASARLYDKYLKANKIKSGLANYGGVVDLVVWWRRKGRVDKFDNEEL